MNLSDILSDRLVQAFGWTILHSLWQGAVIAILLGLVMILMRSYSSNARYFVSVSALMTIFVLGIVTFVAYYRSYQPLPTSPITFALPAPALPTESVERVAESNTWQTLWASTESYFNTHLPLVVSIWLMGVLLLLVRFIGGYAYLQRLRNYQVIEVSAYWQGTLAFLASEIGIKGKVRLLESALAEMPMVIGWLKPVILLPIGTLAGLSVAQVESILAHELAHLKRKDYLVNIFQTLVEIVLFYNPFVWWVSGYIREERENCCDDIAVNVTGDSLTLIKTLTILEELRLAKPQLAMGFAGRKRGGLLGRVRRLLTRRPKASGFSEGFLSAMVLVFCFSITTVNAYTPYNWQNLRALAGKSWEKIQAVASSFVGKAGNMEILSGEPTPAAAPEIISQTRLSTLAPLKPIGLDDTIRFGKGYMGITDRKGNLAIFKDGKEIPKEEFAKHQSEFSVVETPKKAYSNPHYVYTPYNAEVYVTPPLPPLSAMPPMPAIPAVPPIPPFYFYDSKNPDVIIINGKRLKRKERKKLKKGETQAIEQDWERWGEEVGKRFEKWGEKWEKQGEAWEKWGEAWGKWGEEYGKRIKLTEKDQAEIDAQVQRLAEESLKLDEQMRNLKGKEREALMKEREALHKRRQEMREKIQEMHEERREKEHKKMFEENFKPLKDEMVKDGLSEPNPTSCKIEANKKGIKINGKKLTPEQEEKYRKLLNKAFDMPDVSGKDNEWTWEWNED